MIPASTPVTTYDVKTGVAVKYDQWVPVGVNINSPDDYSDAAATPTSASVTLCRCRTLESGKTERLDDYSARRLGVPDRTVSLHILNIYAAATDGGEAFKPESYPTNATPLQKAQTDARNAEREAAHDRAVAVYPKAVRDMVLGAVLPATVKASAVLAAARGVL